MSNAIKRILSDYDSLRDIFEHVYNNIKPEEIVKQVDQEGVKSYVRDLALLNGVVGLGTNAGGMLTSFVGVPVDLTVNLVNLFKTTIAVVYHRTGIRDFGFAQVVSVIAIALGVGLGGTAIFGSIGKKLAEKLLAKGLGRFIPIVGGVLTGGLNYAFIMGVMASLENVDDKALRLALDNN